MIPSAANYNIIGEKVTDYRTEICQPLMEIKRVAEKIYELNKLQKFPFEIPLLIRRVLFSGFYQPEDEFFKEMRVTEFPDYSLAQVMSIVEHECGGTSLLNFSTNKYKALYFAIGKDEDLSRDSWIFGLNVPYFEKHKGHLKKEVLGQYRDEFDFLYPSYFKNTRIAHQEGVFLYQKFKISDCGCISSEQKYKNIITYFESRYEEDGKGKNGHCLFEKKSIDDFLSMTEKEGDKGIFYVLLKVPAKAKCVLKTFLDTLGITDSFMMNTL
jgi:hypothetical protein